MSIRYNTETVLVAYAGKGKAPIFPQVKKSQVATLGFRAINNSGGSINIGLMRLFNLSNTDPSGKFRLWQYTAVGPVATEVTTAIAAGTNIFSTTNNDGYIFQCNRRAGLLGFTVSSASGGGTYTYKYWNGSSFTTLTTLEVPAYSSTTDIYTVWVPPSDWVVGATAGIGLDQTKYSILVQGTTHPTTAVAINALWAAEFIDLYQGVGAGSGVADTFSMREPLILEGGEGLMPYFSTANAANIAGAFYVVI